MALSLSSQWTLVACGIIAHADGVLDGEECDRLLAMVEDGVDGEEYSAWLTAISDVKRLEDILAELPLPPEADMRDILESAWTTAIVDGDRSEAEARALSKIADRLGVESIQLDFWRDAWTASQHEFAEVALESLIVVLAGSAPLPEADRRLAREFLWRLPATNEHRELLLGRSALPHNPDAVARRLAGIPRRRRRWLLKVVAPSAAAASRPAECNDRLLELAANAGLDPEVIRDMLAQA